VGQLPAGNNVPLPAPGIALGQQPGPDIQNPNNLNNGTTTVSGNSPIGDYFYL
jgi:hypothetical protein